MMAHAWLTDGCRWIASCSRAYSPWEVPTASFVHGKPIVPGKPVVLGMPIVPWNRRYSVARRPRAAGRPVVPSSATHVA